MTEETPAKTKKDRTPAQLANDKRNSERLKAHWQAVKAANAKGSETSHKPANAQPETPHPSIPPPKADEEKKAPAAPQRKPFRLLW